jgi:hypothetical protein
VADVTVDNDHMVCCLSCFMFSFISCEDSVMPSMKCEVFSFQNVKSVIMKSDESTTYRRTVLMCRVQARTYNR